MKRQAIFSSVLSVSLLISLVAGMTLPVSAKTMQTKFIVLEGSTRALPGCRNNTICTISDKKYAVVYKEKTKAYSTVSALAETTSYGPLVKGKKAGETTIVCHLGKKVRYFNVEILSRKQVAKIAQEKIKRYIKTMKAAKQCAYMDFNGDGIKELYHDGFFTYYNYVLGRLVTMKAPQTVFRSLVIDSEKHMLFAVPEHRTVLGDAETNMQRKVYGQFFFFDEGKVFDFSPYTVAISQYEKPEQYVGTEYQQDTDYYFLDDNQYDQDDYWYCPYTFTQMQKFLSEKMQNRIEVVFTQTPKIKNE